MRKAVRAATWAAAVVTVSAILARPVSACVGDCNGDLTVAINELIAGVGVGLGNAHVSACAAIDNNVDDRATIDELVLAVNRALDGCHRGPADQVLFSPQDNQLDTYNLGKEQADLHIPSTRGTVNGQVCLLPGGGGNFVLGDDTGQPDVRPGWGIYSPDGTFLKKLTLPTRENETKVPDPLGCVVDTEGRLFTTAIGTPGGTDGQLSVFFPPSYDEACILDTTIATPGSIAVDDDGNVYVPQLGGVLRYAPPFPVSAAECETVKGARTTFINDAAHLVAPLGIARAANGNWYVSVVFGRATVTEYDVEGTYVRDLFAPGTGGTPGGLAVDSEGTVYYADLAIVAGPPPGPARGKGTVRKVTFAADGKPQRPEIVARGLTFPDSVGILPERLEWLTYGGSLRNTFFNPHEHDINPATVGRLVPKWRYLTGAIITASAAVAEIDLPGEGKTRVVFMPSWDRNLYALRASNGSRVWSAEMKPQPGASYPYASSATVAWLGGHPLVYVGGGMTMYCFDAVDGTLIWEFDAGTGCEICGRPFTDDPAQRERNEIEATPTVFNGLVFFAMDTNDSRGKGGMYAVRADDGRLVWYFDVGTGGTCHPRAEDNVRRFDGYHTAEQLGLPDGEAFFSTRPGCDFDRSPTQCGNVWSSVTIDARRGLLYTASANCDTDQDPGTPQPPPPMPPYDEALVALTLDGEPAWVWRPREVDPGSDDFDFGGVPNLFEAEIGGVMRELVGVGDKSGRYYVLDRDGVNAINGVRWDDPPEVRNEMLPYWTTRVVEGGPFGGIIVSAAVAEGKVFFGTAPGRDIFQPQSPSAWALNLSDGEVAWSNPESRPNFAPAMVVPGVVFMGTTFLGPAHGSIEAYATADGSHLARLDAKGLPGGAGSAPTVVGGMVFVGGGIGQFGGSPTGSDYISGSADTPISAFCIDGAPDCVQTAASCDDGKVCTYDYLRDGKCATEAAPDTLSCAVGAAPGQCHAGQCELVSAQ